MKKGFLLVIGGPTASGKTRLSIDLAKHFKAPILSADSRQFYKEIPIGTAAPSLEEQEGVPHYFIGDRSVADDLSVGDYVREAKSLLKDLFAQHDLIVLVGGSGLYIKALCEGLDEFPEVDQKVREMVRLAFAEKGIDYLYEELKKNDPEAFQFIDAQNPQRMMRALEVSISSGKPYSSFRTGTKKERDFNYAYMATSLKRDELYARINQRVDLMVDLGMEEEARNVFAFREKNALKTVGFKEWFSYFDGNLSREEAIEEIKKNTRRFAKRQITWFKKMEGIQWFDPNDRDAIRSWAEDSFKKASKA